jgi:hypothetical protein
MNINDYIKVLPNQKFYILAVDGEILDPPIECSSAPVDELPDYLYAGTAGSSAIRGSAGFGSSGS